MNPGKLNRRLVLQTRVTTRDATGSPVSTWSDSATLFAEAVTQKGNESQPADADRASDSRQFRIRYRSSLLNPNAPSNFRILYQSRFYDIKGITEECVKTTLILDLVATQKIS